MSMLQSPITVGVPRRCHKLSAAMKQEGRVVTLRPPVTSSARRFENAEHSQDVAQPVVDSSVIISGAEPDALARKTKD